MMRRTYKLREIAPPAPAVDEPHGEKVWLLNLDQIEAHTGSLLQRLTVRRADVGSSTHAFDERNVLYSKLRPYLNKVYLPDQAGFCTSELVPMRPNLNLVSREYLAAYLRSPAFLAWVNQQVDGAKMPRVSMKIFWDHEVCLPDLGEQQRIAAIVDSAQRLRRMRQETIGLADDLIRSKFAQMFGDARSNTHGLPTAPLGDVARLKSGDFLPSHEMNINGNVYVYGGNGINGMHDSAMFSEEKLVIGRVGAYCGVVHLTKPNSWVTDNALYVSEISPQIRLEYLALALRQANLNQYSSQSGQPLVSASRLYPVELIVPPMEMQDAFLQVHSSTTEMQETMNQSLREIEILSRALSSAYLT